MVDGVCGGIAEFFGIGPTRVWIGWVLFCALGGGILAYIIAAIVIPRRPEY